MKTLLAAFLVPIATVCAQREQPSFEWQKRTATVFYGPVPTGQHGLSELTIGESWRLGMNEASTWLLAMPLLAGDAWIAPGHYRINLLRTDEAHCAVVVDGAELAVGSGQAPRVPGEIGKASKPAKKLSIDFAKTGAAVAGNQPAHLVVQFGDSEWQGEVLVLGNKTVNVPGGKLAVFLVPAAQLEARDKAAVPIAALSLKAKDGSLGQWNLVVGKTEARLVPWMEAPKQEFGFGAIVPPQEKLVTVGTVSPAEIKIPKARETAELIESSLTKGELRLVVAFGKEWLEIRVPEPKDPQAKAGK